MLSVLSLGDTVLVVLSFDMLTEEEVVEVDLDVSPNVALVDISVVSETVVFSTGFE